VSRLHAELYALGNGRYEIVDKGSANGIRINGVELKRGILEQGDALELGDVRLRYVGAGKIFRAVVDSGLPVGGLAGPHAAKPGLGMGKVVGIGAVVGAMIIGGLIFAFTRPSGAGTANGSTIAADPEVGDGAAQLESAKALFAKKDLEGAHREVIRIPDTSPVHEDPAVKEIEGAWADWMFQKVEQASSSADKKKLLKAISSTPTVDAARRKRAADMVAEIEAKEPPPPPPTYVGGDGVRPSGAGSPTAAPTTTAKSEGPNPVPVAHGGPAVGGPPDEDALRKALEPKVWAGRASIEEIRMLKAICSHLGNRACRDRAAAELKKKMEQK
jgi:hypothetical protein